MKRLDHYWYSQNPLAWMLLPLSWVYCFLVVLRRWFYRTGIFRVYKISVPVIIVGNITVGGTGKTPLLIALCDLIKSMGLNPGVVSRGYGGEATGEHLLMAGENPVAAGDEPVLIKKRTGCSVATGRNRVAAAKLLISNHSCDVILSDDGLQHYRLHRDYEISIVDVSRNHGNGFCIPAGPLREPISRLNSVDLVIYHGETENKNNFYLELTHFVHIKTGETATIAYFQQKTVHAVAGIGHPQRFFAQLKDSGVNIIEHAFPDHHIYSHSELDFGDEAIVLMTEKDAVKCEHLDVNNAWYAPVNAVLSDTLSETLKNTIRHLTHE